MHSLQWCGLGPVFTQIDEIHQFAQATLVTPVEIESKACQVAELRVVVLFTVVAVLLKFIAQPQIGKGML